MTASTPQRLLLNSITFDPETQLPTSATITVPVPLLAVIGHIVGRLTSSHLTQAGQLATSEVYEFMASNIFNPYWEDGLADHPVPLLPGGIR